MKPPRWKWRWPEVCSRCLYVGQFSIYDIYVCDYVGNISIVAKDGREVSWNTLNREIQENITGLTNPYLQGPMGHKHSTTLYLATLKILGRTQKKEYA